MRSQILLLVSALCAGVLSAPTPVQSNSEQATTELSAYFNALATKVQEGKKMSSAPVCDLASAQLPIASPTPLPPPSAGLNLVHVAIGRGTQNYTCGVNSTAAPVAIGANATLFNASCIASSFPAVLATLPPMALSFNLTSNDQSTLSGPSDLAISGHHYFTNTTTPFFNLSPMNLGEAQFAKNNTAAAPSTASIGQGGVGFGAVSWLKLKVIPGETGDLTEVYRVNTAGGQPPLTCAGLEGETFFVQYAAEYWFFAKP